MVLLVKPHRKLVKKHGPNKARKYNHDGYFCKNPVQIITAMETCVKTRSKWSNMTGISNTVLIVTARLQLSSIEYLITRALPGDALVLVG